MNWFFFSNDIISWAVCCYCSNFSLISFISILLSLISFSSLIIQLLILIIGVLLTVAMFTLIERKVLSAIQRRKGPNIVGFFGLLQPIADGLKLFLKETIIPLQVIVSIFIICPAYTFILSLLSWIVIPLGFDGSSIIEFDLTIIYILALSSLGVYGIIFAGWSSNSKYAFLGGLRSAAQMISYELSIGLLFILLVLCARSVNFYEIMEIQREVWLLYPLFPIFIIFCISGLAETNRSPFDLPEAEAELVSGYNVEYSGFGFALFFIAEYANMLLFAIVGVFCFLGGFQLYSFFSDIIWILKVFFFLYGYVWVRATFPRYRYDQLMLLGWKTFLPLILGWLFWLIFLLIILE